MASSALSSRPARWLVTITLSATLFAAVATGCGRTTGSPPATPPGSADHGGAAGSAGRPSCGDQPCPSNQNCLQVVGCTLSDCVDRSTNPPSLTLACVADCLARACPSSQFATDQMVNCAAMNFATCDGGTSCIENACSAELSACVGTKC